MGWASKTLPGEPSDFQRAFDPDAEHADYIIGTRHDRTIAADVESAGAADAPDPSEIGSLLEDLGFEPIDSDEASPV